MLAAMTRPEKPVVLTAEVLFRAPERPPWQTPVAKPDSRGYAECQKPCKKRGQPIGLEP